MKKLLLIINPCAGTKQGGRRLADIVGIFQNGGYLCTVMMTDRRMAASEYVFKYGKDADVIVCVGGDGTFNETINGIITSELRVPVGYIPAGSTNDFASSLHLSPDIINAAQDIVDGSLRTFDAGSFGGRIFSYVASFGAFTKTSYTTPQSFKNAFGHMAYILSGAMDVLSIRSEHMRFETADRVYEDTYIFGAVSNSTSLGGVLTIDPNIVDMSDGKFEVMLIKAPKSMNELLQITNALTRKQYNCDMIDFFSTDSVTVSSEQEIDWSLDGEHVVSKDRIEIKNLHEAVELIVNPLHRSHFDNSFIYID